MFKRRRFVNPKGGCPLRQSQQAYEGPDPWAVKVLKRGSNQPVVREREEEEEKMRRIRRRRMRRRMRVKNSP